MALKNENIGIVVGLVVVAIGLLLTNGDPGQSESALIGVLMMVAIFGVSLYLNERGQVFDRSTKR